MPHPTKFVKPPPLVLPDRPGVYLAVDTWLDDTDILVWWLGSDRYSKFRAVNLKSGDPWPVLLPAIKFGEPWMFLDDDEAGE